MQNNETLEELHKILEFKYVLSPSDLYKTKFPFSKVLQATWGGGKNISPRLPNVLAEFNTYILDNLIELRSLDLVALNVTVYNKVAELQRNYPECFDEVGYYTKQKLAEAYLQGTLVSNGHAVSDEDVDARLAKLTKLVNDYKIDTAIREAEAEDRALTDYQVAMQQYYDDYTPMYEGFSFKTKNDLLFAYRDIADKGTAAERLAKIREYIDVEYTGKGWLVQKILKEDSIYRCPPDYPKPIFNRRKYF